MEEMFQKWIREYKHLERKVVNLKKEYAFWRSRWLSVKGIRYDAVRVQGGMNIDPCLNAFNKMSDIELEIQKIQKRLTEFDGFRDALTEKQKLFFDAVLLHDEKISEYCQKNKVSLSRGYELKSLIFWKWSSIYSQ